MSTYSYMKKGYIHASDILKQMEVISKTDMTEFFIDNNDSNTELDKLIQKLEEGDTVIICSLAVIELPQRKLRAFLQLLSEKLIRLISVEETLDTQHASHRNFYSNSLICLNWEMAVLRNITKRRSRAASERGIELGRPTISEEVIERIRYLRNKEKQTIRWIAKHCDVSIGTVHKYIK